MRTSRHRSPLVCYLLTCSGLGVICPAPLRAQPSTGEGPPNVIVLLVDDWGWTDAACFGSDLYETPHIDQLNAHSVRFVNGYSACTVCSPTRAALMTGLYPARLHLTDYIPGASSKPDHPLRSPAWTRRLEHRYTTIAEALRAAGYRTAHVGKWHLTPPDQESVEDYLPEEHGFDVNLGGNQWGQPGSYFHPYTRRNRSIGTLPPGGREGDYLTDRLTDETVKLIRQWVDQPFFVYFAYYAVHTPIEPKPELRAKYEQRLKPGLRHNNPGFAAMVQTVDDSIGRIRTTLEELHIDDNTVLILTGDNGGLVLGNGSTNNAPLREGKGHVYEGGVRVPTLVHWPGVTATGAICEEPVITMDFYPTILSITGVQGDSVHNAAVDGESLVRLLHDPTASLAREAIFWHYPHYHPGGATPYGAVRAGPWRLVEFYEDQRVELYKLDEDLGESNDLSTIRTDQVARLRDMLHAWREQVAAQMPLPNPRDASNANQETRNR